MPQLTAAVLKRDLTRLRHLLDFGEDPNERDGQGFAPWMWAINFEENGALKLLLEKVSAFPPTDQSGRRTLALTASLNNLVAGRQLLDKGVPVDSPTIDGATPLLVAASSGYTSFMKMLLDAGADPNRQDEYGDTPLMAATRVGSFDAAKLLLNAHIDLNLKDRRGRAALHWAARSGRVDMVRSLVDAGASVDVADEMGKTAMAYAREADYAAVVTVLHEKGALYTPVAPRTTVTPLAAVDRSLPLLIRGWHTWSERQSCGACHHRLMIARVAALARERGFTAATVLADDQVQFFTRSALRSEAQLRKQLATEEGVVASALGIHGDGSSGDALNLNAMLELGVPKSPAIEARALLLARKQLEDGSWRNGLPRVPILSSDFTTTAVAARTVAAFGGPTDTNEISGRVTRARQWLIEHHPLTTDDKASRLLGLRWTHANESVIRGAADLLRREQHVDGGWSQLTGINTDAYATGMVLVALHWGIGLPASDPIYKRGVDYLLRNQETDGSWFVHKRAAAANPFFESGFPHGQFQFISYAGSCWATMALMYAAAPQDAVDLVSGSEFVAGANVTTKNVKAEGTVFVPDGVRYVRAAIVLVESWPGADRSAIDVATGLPRPAERRFVDLAIGRFQDQAWRKMARLCGCVLLHLRLGTIRPDADSNGIVVDGAVVRSGVSNRVVRNAAEGGGDALFLLLRRLGEQSRHQELKGAPLMLWGWSAPANFGTTFAAQHPERTIAFIRYHSHRRGSPTDVNALKDIPALLIAGGNDDVAGTDDAETLWKQGRQLGAPWTFAIEPGAPHASETSVLSSHQLILPWIAAVLGKRLEPGTTHLRPVRPANDWLGNHHSAEVGPSMMRHGAKQDASWLPDEATARGWRTVVSSVK